MDNAGTTAATGQLAREAGAADSRGRLPGWAWTAVVAGAIAGRAWTFQTRADSLDPAQYCWTSWFGFIPHSPYLLYSVLGHAISRVVQPELGLSILSLISNAAATLLFAAILRHQRFSAAASAAALATWLLAPMASSQAGMQEVYALQSFWIMAALYVAHRGGAFRMGMSGALFGLAWLTHNGSVFLLPGIVVLLWQAEAGASCCARQAEAGGPRHTRVQALVRWAMGAGGVIVAGYFVLYLRERALFPDQAAEMTLAALRGISPLPTLNRSPYGLWAAACRILDHLAHPMGLDWPYLLAPLVVAASFAVTADRGRLAGWSLLTLPYIGYELLLGGSPDIGDYLVYFLPFVAVAVGELHAWLTLQIRRALDRAHRLRLTPEAISVLQVTPLLLLIGVPALRYPVINDPPFWLTGHEKLGRPLMQWVAANTPETTLIEPAGRLDVGAPGPFEAGCWARRQPILLHDRDFTYKVVRTPRWGSTDEGPFLEELTPEGLAARLKRGQWVLSLSAHPFPAPNGAALRQAIGTLYDVRPCRAGTWRRSPSDELFRLVLPGAPAEVSCETKPSIE